MSASNLRSFSLLDKLICQIDICVHTVFAEHEASNDYPAEKLKQRKLTEVDRKISSGLMRVNHAGEVCAQALYQSQLLLARSENTKNTLLKACA